MMLLLRVIHLLLLYLFGADSTLNLIIYKALPVTHNRKTALCSCLDPLITTTFHTCQKTFSGTLIAYTHCKFWFVASNSLLKGLKYIWWITPHPIKNLHWVAIDYSCKPTFLNQINQPKIEPFTCWGLMEKIIARLSLKKIYNKSTPMTSTSWADLI